MTKLKKVFMHFWGVISHKCWVSFYGLIFIFKLFVRIVKHDCSKLRPSEVKGFIKIIGNLNKLEYGSEEYDKNLKELNSVLTLHYQRNVHHPEHFNLGVYDMSLVDLVEMVCDWQAAARRCRNGDVSESLSFNKKRFKLDNQVTCLLRNYFKGEK